jgi:hypothetical protein
VVEVLNVQWSGDKPPTFQATAADAGRVFVVNVRTPDGATGSATVTVSAAGAPGGTVPSLLGGSTTKTDPGTIVRGGTAPPLNAPPPPPPPPTGPPPATTVNAAPNWAGTWVGSYNYTLNISGGGSSISASFQYQQVGASGSGQWSNCRVTGNTAECDYTAQHDDVTKSGSRRGKLKFTLNGDTMTGTLYEDEPKWTYKGDRNASNVSSAMYKGAQFQMTFKRQ